MLNPPELIKIKRDDIYAEYLGRTADQKQFFLTSPWLNNPRRDFIALYIFDLNGNLIEAKIDELETGKRHDEHLLRRRLKELGKKTYRSISVAPFMVSKFDIKFGLIPKQLPENNEWWVFMEPGNYMGFNAPWDSGEYYT